VGVSNSQTFIDVPTAAKRSGLSKGHITRDAANKWRAAGLAEMQKPAKGKPRWMIREDADPAFARIKSPEHIQVDLRQFTAKQRDEAWRREGILKEWDEFCVAAFKIGYDRVRATNTFIDRLLIDKNTRVSMGTLYNWQRAYRAEGIVGLIDGRTGKEISKDAGGPSTNEPDPFLSEVQRLFLNLNQLKLTSCLRIAEATAREQGWKIRSYKMCQRHIAKIPAGVVTKMRGGEDAYVARAETWIEKDYTSIDSNEIWCADHHQMDCIVSSQGKLLRPWLSVFQDIRSRKIMGWLIVDHAPNADTILSVFRAAVKEHGVPYHIYLDNGKDYDCYALNGRTKKDRYDKSKIKIQLPEERSAGIFPQLSIQIHHVWPYHGQSKPIESWFRNPAEWNRAWPTYTGNNTANKPEDRSAGGTLCGGLQLNLERGKAPRIEDYIAWFGDLLAAHEAGHQHSGQGMFDQTADNVYAACLHTRRTAPEDLLDLLCLKRVGPMKVGRNGVTWQGIRYGQHESALHQLLGKDVILRIDERYAGHVQVYSTNDKLICVAQSNQMLPWNSDAQDLREAIAAKRKDRTVLKTFVQRRPRIAEDLPDRLVRAAAAKAAAMAAENTEPEPSGPNLLPIQHAMTDQLPALQRALEASAKGIQRVAVGAESTQLVDVAKFMSDREETTGGSEPDAFARLGAKFRSDHDE
jgi:transposase